MAAQQGAPAAIARAESAYRSSAHAPRAAARRRGPRAASAHSLLVKRGFADRRHYGATRLSAAPDGASRGTTPSPSRGPSGYAAASRGESRAKMGKDDPRVSGAAAKLEVRPTGRPVSLRDVTLPEVSTLSRAQMNWQLIRRVAHPQAARRVLTWRSALRSAPRRLRLPSARSAPIARLPRAAALRSAQRAAARCSEICRGRQNRVQAALCLQRADCPPRAACDHSKKQVLVLNAARRFRHCAENAALEKKVNAEVRTTLAIWRPLRAAGALEPHAPRATPNDTCVASCSRAAAPASAPNRCT